MFLRFVLLGLHALLWQALPTFAESCDNPAPSGVTHSAIAAAASREHREFGGHVIHQDGTLWKFGTVESASDSLRNPDTGNEEEDRFGRVAWRRVWSYWQALERHAAGEALSRKVLYLPGLLENADSVGRLREIDMRTLLSENQVNDPAIRAALAQAAVRAAINDAAWSAAFIAYVMDAAQLSNQQFRYSAAHAFYIQRAFQAPPDYAFRACDPRTTTPRPGDLLCYSRGTSPLKNFDDWKDAVNDAGFAVASHCDVVIEVDLAANKMDTVGGNVLQSVTRRTLKLDAANRLSRTHHPDASPAPPSQPCAIGKACTRENFNLQYWSVLLQLK
ncbi:MAG: DUF2272 domain-containing protein [Herminiimonas sp.]|nr:DUF2272 domain-containing protein [Herminiimonas sp.]